MDILTFDLPACWASALINNDDSGLDARETNDMNQWYLKNTPGLACINVSESSFLGHFNGLMTDLATYSFINKFPSKL